MDWNVGVGREIIYILGVYHRRIQYVLYCRYSRQATALYHLLLVRMGVWDWITGHAIIIIIFDRWSVRTPVITSMYRTIILSTLHSKWDRGTVVW